MRQHVLQRPVGEELEGLQLQARAERGEHLHQHLEAGHGQQHHVAGRRRVGQLHGGFDDHAQRALRTDQQLAEVIAAGVLDQALVELEQFATGGDHLQPGDPLAGVAVADHSDAAGIGGNVAADRARAARGEIHRVDQAVVQRGVVHGLQRHAGLHHQGAIDRVVVQRPVHPLQAEHQLAVGRHRATREAGAAARRHHRHALGGTPAHHRLYLLDRGRQCDRQRRRRPAPGPVAPVMLQVGRVGLQLQAGTGLLQRGNAGIGHDGPARGVKNGQACQRHAPASSPADRQIATDATNCALHHERPDLA